MKITSFFIFILHLIPFFLIAQTLPSSSEFQINTTTANSQTAPSVAMDAVGNFVTVWYSNLQDGSGFGVYGQRFDNTTAMVGSEFQVNTFTTGNQFLPEVAMNDNGAFVVVWTSSGQDGSGDGVFGQLYNSNGTTNGSEFQINTFTLNSQTFPQVAMDNSGNFVVVWGSPQGQDGSSGGVYAQRFNSSGTPIGNEFLVNTTTVGSQGAATIAMENNGDFVIVWNASSPDFSNTEINAQRYDSNGNTVGGEFLVNTTTVGNQTGPRVAMDDNGNFVIGWTSRDQDGSGDGIFAQRFNNGGTPIGSEFQVNTFTNFNQQDPNVKMDSGGNFIFVWQSEQDGSGRGVYAQRYDASGNPVGTEFICNDNTFGCQSNPSVGMDNDGDFIAVWNDGAQGPDPFEIFGQLNEPIILPVELTAFSARLQNQKFVELTWETASEINNEGFAVERSLDGKNWEELSFVRGNGTTNKAQIYQFFDKNPVIGTNYYRLKQMDFDGKINYSMVIQIQIEIKPSDIYVYPNPVERELIIETSNPMQTIEIYNYTGSLVHLVAGDSKRFVVQADNLTKGIYFLKIQLVNGQVSTVQLVK